MSDHHYDFPKTTVKQVIFAAVGGLVPPLIVIILIVNYVLGIQASHIDDLAPAKVDTSEIEARIKPVAVVEKAANVATPAGQAGKSGEEVVTAVCSACHGSGAMGAPKPGDNAAWAPRIAQGYETLTKHAIEGIRQMPARGGASDLSDNEVAAAVAFMANQSGAKFAAPATPAAATAPASGGEAAAANAGKSGEEIVKASCAACHESGTMGAPKISDTAAWAPRIAQGYDTLKQHATNGIRSMPAKGGNPGLTDTELARAVAYLANQGGAKFTAP